MKTNNLHDLKPGLWVMAICVLAIPAFFINLGLLCFIEDESIRSIVAFEMLQSGNFITPTINGDFYYYKPPLYNWFIAFSFWISGIVNEWSARIPTVLFCFLYTYTIYRYCLQYLSKSWAIISAFASLTCGRILFWDSFLGLIDIAYSWVTFSALISLLVIKSKEKKFLSFYLLHAVGYLMKGFPSIVFIILSLFAYQVYQKSFKELWSKWNFIGIASFGLVITSFYGIYALFHDPGQTFAPLLDQATRRTPLHHSLRQTLEHIISYPFENIFHFLPWSFLSILLFRIQVIKKLLRDDFARFNALMFMCNIIVYWVSPGVYPRYILMLVPFYFSFFIYVYVHSEQHIWKTILHGLLLSLIIVMPCLCVYAFFVEEVKLISAYPIKLSVLICLYLMSILFLMKHKAYLFPCLILVLLITRIGFNLFILPIRNWTNGTDQYRSEVIQMVNKYQPLELYKKSRLDKTSSFYLASSNGKVNQRRYEFSKKTYYIFDPFNESLTENHWTIVDSFPVREFNRKAYIIQFE